MGLALEDIRDAVREYIDDRNASRFGNDQLLNFINRGQEAIQEIIDEADENMFSACQVYAVVATPTGTYAFTLPTNFKKLLQAERMVDSGEPIPAVYVDFRRRHQDTASMIYPYITDVTCEAPRYSLLGTQFLVIAPQDAYDMRVWYTKRIADLANDSDESEIPKEYCNLIALYAAMLSKGEREGASGAFPGELGALYASGVESLKRNVEQRSRQAPRQVNYDWED